MNLISICKSITAATDFQLSWRSEILNCTYHCISTDTVPLFWKLISTWFWKHLPGAGKAGWLTACHLVVSWQRCCVVLVKCHPFIRAPVESLPARKERQQKKMGRKTKKEKQLQLIGEKNVAFSIYELCSATNKTWNSKSISQRLRKKVRRERIQLAELNQQILSSANLIIVIASSLKVLQNSAAHWNSTSYGQYLLLGLINYKPVTPKFSTWIN